MVMVIVDFSARLNVVWNGYVTQESLKRCKKGIFEFAF